MEKLMFLPNLFALGVGACATTAQNMPEPTAEQYICADPAIRSEKGGQVPCEAFYSALRGEEDVCAGIGSTVECVKLLRGLELAGFSPNKP